MFLALFIAFIAGFVAWWSAMFSITMMDADRQARATEFALVQAGWDLGRIVLAGGLATAAVALIVVIVTTLRLRVARRD